MTSNLFLIDGFYRNIFRCFFVKKETFSELLCAFFKSTLNLEHFQKKVAVLAYLFLKLPSPKDVVR